MLSAALLDANQASGGNGQSAESAESADLGAGRRQSLGTQRSWQKFSGWKGNAGNAPKSDMSLDTRLN